MISPRLRWLTGVLITALFLDTACGEPTVDNARPKQPALRSAKALTPTKSSVCIDGARVEKAPNDRSFAAQVVVVEGDVKVRSRLSQPMVEARVADQLFAGGRIVTSATGNATVVVRDLGTLVLHHHTHLFISPYTRSPAVLVRGLLRLSGLPEGGGEQWIAALHTPAVTIRPAVGAQAVIAVAENGHTRSGATKGEITSLDISGNAHKIRPQTEIEIAPISNEIRLREDQRRSDRLDEDYQRWLNQMEQASSPGKPSAERNVIIRARQYLNRLVLDVERLLELKQLNLTLSSRLQSADDKSSQLTAIERSALKEELVEQAREMVDLQKKGAIQIQRVVALTESAELLSRSESDLARLQEIRRQLESLSRKLPALFAP